MGSRQVSLYAPIVRSAPPRENPSERIHERDLSRATSKDAQMRTGIFFPDAYVPGPKLNLVVYFHGLLDRCSGSGSDSIHEYWNNKHFQLRDWVNASKKNAVLVVPRLGDPDKRGSKLGMDGNDFLKKVEEVIAERVKTEPFNYTGAVKIQNIALAAHSGGGTTMLRLAQTGTVGKICECWGLDSFYYPNPQEWVDWAAPGRWFSLFWHDEEKTGANVREFQRLLTLKANAVAANNVFVKYTGEQTTLFSATTRDHCEVPKTYFPDLLTRNSSCLS
jgi:hypothetical protein